MKRKDNTDADYIYRGQTIKPQIIADLVKQLFAGKLVERQTIIDEVLNTHLKGGGLRAEGANFPLSVTKALTKLKKLGEAENPSYSYWKILPADTEATPEHADLNGSATLSDIESAAAHIPNDPLAEVTIGTGPGCVYVYYLPTYKMRAQERGERSWPCKIGETEGNALHRVLSQVATALPERPIFPVVFRSNYSKALEKAFHGVFTLRGLRIEDVPGVEWFLTSPSEIIRLAKVFDPPSYGTLTIQHGAIKGAPKIGIDH